MIRNLIVKLLQAYGIGYPACPGSLLHTDSIQ